MSEIAKHTLTVHSLEETDQPLHVITSLANWSGYLLETSENLSDLLPDGYYVEITQDTQEGENSA